MVAKQVFIATWMVLLLWQCSYCFHIGHDLQLRQEGNATGATSTLSSGTTPTLTTPGVDNAWMIVTGIVGFIASLCAIAAAIGGCLLFVYRNAVCINRGVPTESTDGIQLLTMDNDKPDHARIELPQVDTSLPGRPKIQKMCKVSASTISSFDFEHTEDEKLEELACKDLTDQIHQWEETQRQKRKKKLNEDVDRKVENTLSPLQEKSTNLTPVEDQSDTLDGVLSVTCHVDQESSSTCPVNVDGQTEDLSDKPSQSDTNLRSVPKKSWRERALEDYRKKNPDVSIEEPTSSLWDAKERITGKPQYVLCDNGELGILHIVSSNPRTIRHQIQALLYAGKEKGIKFCVYINKTGKEGSDTKRINPDSEWQERVVPKVHKYCEYFDQQWKQVQLQYGSK